MYQTLFPVTHHFYPLQHYTNRAEAPFSRFLETLQSTKPEPTENLIYLHIPYCEKKCIFCPFHVRVDKNFSIYERYVSALEAEIERLGRVPYVREMQFQAVYIGGGSPSLLSVPHVRRLYDALRAHLDIVPSAEWTFEGEPNGLSDESLLEYLAAQGTRRLSYGIQTFDESLRKTLNIAATVDDVLTCQRNAKTVGFDEINVDMMFHLPGQTLEDVERDVTRLAECEFDSIDYYYMSYYGLPQSAFIGMEKGTFPKRPPIELRMEMSHFIRHRLRDLGYYDVTDHVFSKKPRGSDYYRLLWGGGFGEHRAETLAIGASARGYLAGYSYANTLAHDAYIAHIEESAALPVGKVSNRLRDERNRGLVFFPKFFSIEREKLPDDAHTRAVLQSLIDGGMAIQVNGSIELTDDGKDWIPNITVELFEDEQRAIGDEWVAKLSSHYSNRVTL